MSNHDPLTLLSLRENAPGGAGDFGSNSMLCIGTLYLLKFYTDELGDACILRWNYLLLVAKFFTAYRYAHRRMLPHAVILAQKESFGLYSGMRHFR